MKAQVIPLPTIKNNSLSNKKKCWRYTDYDWDKIRRANNRDSFLSEKAVKILSNVVYGLQQKKVVTRTHSYLTKLTKCKYEQNNNIINQLKDVLNITFNRSGIENGESYNNRFEFKVNENTYKILEDPEAFYKKKTALNNLKNSDNYTEKNKPSSLKKFSEQSEKIQTTLYIYKEKEKEELENSLTAIFSNSVLNVNTIVENTNSNIVSLPNVSSKPRICVQARSVKTSTLVTEQSDLLCYPKGAASQTCSIKQKKPTKLLTSREEREHYRNHQDRDNVSQPDFTLTADILSLANLLPPKTSEDFSLVEQLPTNRPQGKDTMKAYDWEDPTKKLELAISRNFDCAMAQELTTSIDYRYSESEHKMRLVLRQKLAISEQNKSRLKQLIKGIYGDDTEIVTAVQNDKKTDVVKLSLVQEKFSNNEQNQTKIDDFSQNPLWRKAKVALVERHGDVLIDHWFSRMQITEEVDKIIFDTSDAAIEYVTSKFQSTLMRISEEINVTLCFVGRSKVQAGKVDIIEITKEGVFNA